MRALKIILSFIVIVGSIGVGIFIIGQSVLGKGDKISLKNPPVSENIAELNSLIPKVQNDPPAKSEPLPNPDENKNSTEEFAKKIAEKLIKKNPEGPSILDGKSIVSALDPEKLTDEILAEELGNFDYESLKTEVKASSLKIMVLPSKSDLENYFRKFNQALTGPLAGVKISGNDLSPQDMDLIALGIGKMIAGLYNLPVPSDLADWHAEEITLLTAQKNIYETLANVQYDPVKALLVIGAVQELDGEFKTLTAKFNKFIADNGLSI